MKSKQAVLDGEIVALDEDGRPSFSLMQQRSGLTLGPKRRGRDKSVPIVYYAFDLLYADGYDLMRVDLEKRKEVLKSLLETGELVRYSDHVAGQGEELYRAAREQKLEGIVAKKRNGCYIQKRSREWLKMKITMQQECVIGGYTDPRGSREHFGSIVLGLYDDQDRLVPVGRTCSCRGFGEGHARSRLSHYVHGSAIPWIYTAAVGSYGATMNIMPESLLAWHASSPNPLQEHMRPRLEADSPTRRMRRYGRS